MTYNLLTHPGTVLKSRSTSFCVSKETGETGPQHSVCVQVSWCPCVLRRRGELGGPGLTPCVDCPPSARRGAVGAEQPELRVYAHSLGLVDLEQWAFFPPAC